MSKTILPLKTAAHHVDVRPLAYALELMHPDLLAVSLPGETVEQALARMDACADIFDDLLAEFEEVAA
jgi:hypothetical protein